MDSALAGSLGMCGTVPSTRMEGIKQPTIEEPTMRIHNSLVDVIIG